MEVSQRGWRGWEGVSRPGLTGQVYTGIGDGRGVGGGMSKGRG